MNYEFNLGIYYLRVLVKRVILFHELLHLSLCCSIDQPVIVVNYKIKKRKSEINEKNIRRMLIRNYWTMKHHHSSVNVCQVPRDFCTQPSSL